MLRSILLENPDQVHPDRNQRAESGKLDVRRQMLAWNTKPSVIGGSLFQKLIRSQTDRQMFGWAHYRFRQRRLLLVSYSSVNNTKPELL